MEPWIFVILAGYLGGAIPFGYIVGKAYGIDIRTRGSGNIGFTNVFRELGTVPGIMVLVADILKGYLAVKAAMLLVPHTDTVWVLAGVAAVMGHTYTIFLRFKGGKGVATIGGAILALMPEIAGIVILIWAATLLLTRYMSVASSVGAISFPLVTYVMAGSPAFLVFSLLACILVLVKHKSNFKLLVKGEERKFRFRRAQPERG